MVINCTQRNGNLIVKIRGEIDQHTTEQIRKTVEGEFGASDSKNIIFDFAHVGFMDSSGIGMLIGRYKEVSKGGGRVFAINIGPEISRIFDISGLRKIIPCFAGLDEIENTTNIE